MVVVAVTGTSTDLGPRLRHLLDRDRDINRIVDLDGGGDLKPLLEGVDVAVDLANDADRTRRLLDAAGGAGVGHVVLLSTAMVYGAWPDNPVPLTEDAPLRPNPGFALAADRVEAERLLGDWLDAHPGSTAAILRPTVILCEGTLDRLPGALLAAADLRAGDEAPAQFVHLDDVASAVQLAVAQRLDGVFNVAPEGWIAGEQVRALAGPRPRVRLPERLARRLSERRWPGLLPYATDPWVVASDRLRAAGWHPRESNEEAFVAGHQPGPLANLSPKRRQELALAGAAVGIVGAVAGIVALVRRRRGTTP
ncbi:MAG: NAD-dependent epimerase/dehydratase family protein [Actinomycetota bacterium]